MSTTLQDLDPLEEEWLTLKDVAQYFDVCRETARQIAHQPGFPLFRRERLHRIPKAAFLRWVAAQTGQAGPCCHGTLTASAMPADQHEAR